MAHMIDESTGRPAFTFNAAEGAAWHGLGNPIPESDAMDPAAIARHAGADYKVYKAPVYFKAPDGSDVEVPNRECLVRDDTGAPLEVLSGNRYTVHQPAEYFEAFRDSLAANNLRISSAGVLKGGRIVFVNAKFTDAGHSTLGIDPVDTYICLGGGYDGTMASFGYLSSVRTVCWNTLSYNMAKTARGGNLYRMTHAAEFDGRGLTAALGLAGAELRVRANVWDAMARAHAPQAEVAGYFADVMELDKAAVAAGNISGRSRNILNELANVYMTGPGSNLATAKGTWYGALNAVTHYVDHGAATRDMHGDGTGAARFASAQFGSGAKVKQRALELAMQNAGIADSMLLAA